ncbi:hypothetical protein ACFFGR_08955 [Arthrobacter liuii]|uniref:Uncharacterized protein n=1 Tax=Arthrobacter liuii TaxID=1476996 RepID=A0ABQ2B0R7_9MICC|nr:hypothetical protein [Arthrobacter liuii]GGI02015.1 hypothetical protein GCM10007170_42760 [Arthrobacter liuii]
MWPRAHYFSPEAVETTLGQIKPDPVDPGLVMLRQLLNVAKAVHDMHKASSDLRRARQIGDLVKHQLCQVAAALWSVSASVAAVDNEGTEAVRTSAACQALGRSVGSVLPPKYEQARTRSGTSRQDIER